MEKLHNIRNIGMVAHIDAGKTSTTEGMLFYSGLTHRYGHIDEGTTVMDYLDEERARGITIKAAAATIPWGESLIHLIDTPGHIDFTAEVERSLRVSDAAVVIFSGVEGVEAQSEKVWHQACHYKIPKIAFINKLDRLGASFQRVRKEIEEKFGSGSTAIQLPVGTESEFNSVIDLISLEIIRFSGEYNEIITREAIPAELEAKALAWREDLIERLADLSDEIAELYIEGKDIPGNIIKQTIRQATLANKMVPILTGSAKNGIGIQPLLNAVVDYLPSPDDYGQISSFRVKDGTPVKIEPDETSPFSGLIFNVVASATADLLYLRTYSGTLKTGAKLVNSRTGEKVTAKQILRLFAKSTESIEQVGPGDIVGLIGPRDCGTGDTLCDNHHLVAFETMQFPEKVISMAVEPKSSREKERLDEALSLLAREDPTLGLDRDEDTGQRLLSGMGELHLEINLKRLKTEFNLMVRAGAPRVAYRETLKGEKTIRSDFHKYAGEMELEAGVEIHFRPFSQSRGQEVFTISSQLDREPDIPKKLAHSARQALEDGLKTGGNTGYSLIYVEAEIIKLTIHPEKTTENAVVGAVLQAVNQAITEIGTSILEPLMQLEILTPEEHVGDVSSYLRPRRALIQKIVSLNENKRILCEVPLSEMFGFGKALPKLTGGRGSFTMEPCGYQLLEQMNPGG